MSCTGTLYAEPQLLFWCCLTHKQLLAGLRQRQHLAILAKSSLEALSHETYQLPAVEKLL